MNFNLTTVFLTFIIYSFFGYILEIIVCSLSYKKIVNRGFLFGPWCPIYGIGALLILLTLLRYKYSVALVFIFGVLITTTIEYYTSYILEKIFHNKWWDYSNEKFNIHGRIFLQNTLLFGLGTLVIIYPGDKIITNLLSYLSPSVINIVAIILLFVFIIDFIYSFIIAYNLRNRIIICEELKNEKLAKIPGMLEKILREKVARFKTYPKRLLEAFPNLKNSNAKEFDLMKKIRDKKKIFKKKRKNNTK